MKSSELFQVLLRVLGVWLLFGGVRALCSSVYYILTVGFSSDVVGSFLTSATPSILVGLYLLSGAEWVVELCYGDADGEDTAPTSPPDDA